MGWILNQASNDVLTEYKEKAKVNSLMANVLANRGLSADAAGMILNNPKQLLIDPLLLVNVEKAAREIIEAIEVGAEIWVFADYDMDGMTSGYTMADFLKSTTDNEVFPYFPNRVEGYGLNMDFCQAMLERKNEHKKEILVITVDNGTSCIEQVKFLKDNNIRIVVTDHHQPKGILPDCTIVNPHIVEDTTYHHLCGCGVAYKVIEVIQYLAKLPKDYTSKYLYAVAFGTIADMMPLTPENMALVRLGLEQVNGKDCPYSIKILKEFLGKKTLTPSDIGWEIGPRFNACGRMGDSDKGGLLFFMTEENPKGEVLEVILDIEEMNEERKAETDRAKTELSKIDFSQDYVCLFDASKYPAGIAGIIASKILEQEGKPALVYSGNEVLGGSSRAPEWMNLQPLFENEVRKGNLVSYGGHEQAAGFQFLPEKYFDLRDSLNAAVKELFDNIDFNAVSANDIIVDAEIKLTDVNKQNYEAIQSFPYNRSTFTAPVLQASNLEVVSFKESKNNANNICLTLRDESGKQMMIWAWGFSELYHAIGDPKKIDLIGSIDINFMNKSQFTLKVTDMREAV